MTHSHDRTLLASLSFGDPDKKDPMHDLACEYLSQQEQARRLVELLEPAATSGAAKRVTLVSFTQGARYYEDRVYSSDEHAHKEMQEWCPKSQYILVEASLQSDDLIVESNIESAISKGDGQYKTTIGFLDVSTSWERRIVYAAGKEARRVTNDGRIIIEVKIGSINVGDVVRQINLYRQYVGASAWVLATAFDLDAGQVDMLRQAKIHPIRLGAGFSNWYEHRLTREKPKLEQF